MHMKLQENQECQKLACMHQCKDEHADGWGGYQFT